MCTAHAGFVKDSGIQSHSVGPHFPVRTVQHGDLGLGGYLEATAFGVSRISYGRADHNANLDRMKYAEQITDTILAAKRAGEGCSVCLNRDALPDSGYVVGIDGDESRFDLAGRNYNAVYADVLEKLEKLACVVYSDEPICIGSWVNDGQLVLDISVVYTDRDDALLFGASNNQTAVFDIVNGVDIAVDSGSDDETYGLYEVNVSSIDYESSYIVGAGNAIDAASAVSEYRGSSAGNYITSHCDDCAARVDRAGALHFSIIR